MFGQLYLGEMSLILALMPSYQQFSSRRLSHKKGEKIVNILVNLQKQGKVGQKIIPKIQLCFHASKHHWRKIFPPLRGLWMLGLLKLLWQIQKILKINKKKFKLGKSFRTETKEPNAQQETLKSTIRPQSFKNKS